jgi:hypothetical protein
MEENIQTCSIHVIDNIWALLSLNESYEETKCLDVPNEFAASHELISCESEDTNHEIS